MNFRTTRAAFGKAGMMALLALWATVAIAGMNEDLLAALARGDLPEVKRLLAKGADVNAKGMLGRTALYWASDSGHREIQEMLVKAGVQRAPSSL